jgi:hypothetical protein
MNSNLDERVFWKNSGWYLSLREEDKNVVSFLGQKRIQIRSGDFGVIAGPFDSMELLENWFSEFLRRHSDPRKILSSREGEQQITEDVTLMPILNTDQTSSVSRYPAKLELVELNLPNTKR